MEDLYTSLGLSNRVQTLVKQTEESLEKEFKKVDKIAQYNTMRVMKAFYDNRVSEAHFVPTSGYGYDDLGRDTLDKVYADVFGAEDALVRHNFISGTHTLSTALFGVLRPNDTLFSITGTPYDTLEKVIGLSGESGDGSLKDFGVSYRDIDMTDEGIDLAKATAILKEDNTIKAVFIQRSKGYGVRKTLSVDEIGAAVSAVKAVNPNVICMVDNCYGEFVEDKEPTAVGADMIMGSLIKNPGGGLAQTGGYIAGRADLIELCAYRLTSVGIGKECGASLGQNKPMYQGFFMAPHVVAQAIKAAMLCAGVFDALGYPVEPKKTELRHDIIQTILFKDADELVAFCGGIQKGAPVDSYVTPEPWDMPGYSDQVVMAAGAFVQGASIELSADAPIREPYVAYMQGGLTYESARYAVMVAAQNIINRKG